MKWKILQLVGLLALAVGVLFAVPAIATASVPPLAITPGASCPHERHYGFAQAANGHWYQCLPEKDGNRDKPWHWEGSEGPTVAPTQPTTPPPTTGAPVPASPTASGSAAPDTLPVTGTKEDWMAAVGVVALGLGGAALWLGRRRRSRIRFTS